MAAHKYEAWPHDNETDEMFHVFDLHNGKIEEDQTVQFSKRMK